MTEFLAYIVFPIVLFLFIKSIKTNNIEARKAEIERQEKEREEYIKQRIEYAKKSIRLRKKYQVIQIKDENPLLKLFGLERYKD